MREDYKSLQNRENELDKFHNWINRTTTSLQIDSVNRVKQNEDDIIDQNELSSE